MGLSPSMNRRTALVVLGTAGASGCLRLTDGPGAERTGNQSTGGQQSSLGAPDQDRAAAKAAAGELATGQGTPLPDYEPTAPDGIRFSRSSAGASLGRGDDATTISPDLNITPIADEPIRFTAQHALRVRNATTGSSIRFQPDAGMEGYETDRIRLNTDSDGMVYNDISLFTPNRDPTTVEPRGQIVGDKDIFQQQLFARYAVELRDGDDAIVGSTGVRTFGFGYRFRVTQAASSAFITRQPLVRDDWVAEFELGSFGNTVGTQLLDNAAEEEVFEIDLTAFDADPGIYEWRLTLKETAEDQRRGGIITLQAHGNQVIVIESD